MPITPRQLVADSTYRLRLVARKDGAVWDLTGAAVTVILRSGADGPAAARTEQPAVVDSPANGRAYYDLSVDDLDAARRHRLQFRVVQGTVDMTSKPYPLEIV